MPVGVALPDSEGNALWGIVFADGAALERQALFVHPAQRQRSDLARTPQMPTVGAQVGIAAGERIAAAVMIDQELAWAAFAANHSEQE